MRGRRSRVRHTPARKFSRQVKRHPKLNRYVPMRGGIRL